jgi:acyl-coenzyme A thioesterase PaaI-like protein
VHGAIVAGAFDQVLALVNVLVGHPAMTGTLTIKYRRPTPLHEELRFVARTDRVEGRKVFASATLHAGETLVAESEGVFILVTAMPAVP